MERAPNWTEAEFEVIVKEPERSDAVIATLLGSRREDAVAVAREGIHLYHRGMNVSMLSEMMVRRLDDHNDPVYCQRCGVAV